MRILMISDVYFPRVNGVSTSIQTFRRAFLERGHEVTLVAPDYGQSDTEAGIERIPARYLVVDPEDRMMKMDAILEKGARLAREHYDIVHIQTPFVAHNAGIKLARRLSLPRVESYHTFFEEYLYHYVPFLPKAAMRFAARRFSAAQCNNVDGLIVPSTAMLEVLRGYGIRSRAEVIPTGIDLRRFRGGDGARFRAKHGIAPERPVLVHVGRVAFEKNIDFLLEVVVETRKSIAEVLMIIAGEGPALRQLKERVAMRDLQNNVMFIGYLDRESALLDCYRAGDAFVFASRTETQGLVLLEAMALGVPVVSTAVMGTRDILAPERGALVAQENINDFSSKVIALLRDGSLRSRLAGDAVEYVRDWSEGRQADRLLGFYDEVIVNHAVQRTDAPSPVRPENV